MTEESLPTLVCRATGPPDCVTALPAASFTCSVIVESAEPLAGMDVGAADSIDLDASAEPGATENVVAALSGPEDAVIVIGPANWPTIVTEAMPPVEVFEPSPVTVPGPDVFVNVTGEAAVTRLRARIS